jgi:hypothetical protein
LAAAVALALALLLPARGRSDESCSPSYEEQPGPGGGVAVTRQWTARANLRMVSTEPADAFVRRPRWTDRQHELESCLRPAGTALDPGANKDRAETVTIPVVLTMRAGGAVAAEDVSTPSVDARVDSACVARRLAGSWEGAVLRGPVVVVRLQAELAIRCVISRESLPSRADPFDVAHGSGGGGRGEGTIGLAGRSESCVASDVALQSLLEHQECRIATDEVQAPNPAAQALVLEARPSGRLVSGQTAEIAVVLRNRSRAPIPLYYAELCAFEPPPIQAAFGIEVVGRKGLEVMGGIMELKFAKDTSRCERPVYRFTVPPGRGVSAVIRFTLALPRGAYRLRVTFSSTSEQQIVGTFKARVQ